MAYAGFFNFFQLRFFENTDKNTKNNMLKSLTLKYDFFIIGLLCLDLLNFLFIIFNFTEKQRDEYRR